MNITTKLLFLLSLSFLLSCGSDKKSKLTDYKLIHAVPVNSTLIIESSDLKNTISKFNNSAFFHLLKSTSFYKNLKGGLNDLQGLIKEDVLEKHHIISFSNLGKNNFKPLFIFSVNDTLNFNSKILKEIDYDSVKLYQYKYKKKFYYFGKMDRFNLISSEKLLIEEGIRQLKSDSHILDHQSFDQVYETLDEDADLNIMINFDELDKFSRSILNNVHNSKINSFAKWQALDIEIEPKEINGLGVSFEPDSIGSYISSLKNMEVSKVGLWSKIPNNFQNITRYGIPNFKSFQKNYNTYLNNIDLLYKRKRKLKNHEKTLDDIQHWYGGEWANLEIEDKKVIICKINDPVHLNDNLHKLSTPLDSTHIYKNTSFFELKNPIVTYTYFLENIPKEVKSYGFVSDEYLYISSDKNILKGILDYQNLGKTLDKNEDFQTFIQKFPKKSNQLFVLNRSINKKRILHHLKKEDKTNTFKSHLNQLGYIGFHTKMTGDKAQTQFSIQMLSEEEADRENKLQKNWEINLNKSAIYGPKHFTNYLSEKQFTVVQTEDYKIHLIDSNGNIQWSKQIDSPIISEIQEVDIFNNGRVQMFFNTKNKIYWLPINNQNLAPYPYSISSNLPVGLFDYDYRGQYRILVAKGNKVKMYDKNMKIVTGFKLKEIPVKESIISIPQHFKFRGKDYILLKTNHYLLLYNRLGSLIRKFKINSKFDSNKSFIQADELQSITTDGQLIKIDLTKLKLSAVQLASKVRNFKVVNNYSSYQTKNQIISNKLKINITEVNKIQTEIFLLKGKLYTLSIDQNLGEATLFDSKGKELEGSPLSGNLGGKAYLEKGQKTLMILNKDGKLTKYNF